MPRPVIAAGQRPAAAPARRRSLPGAAELGRLPVAELRVVGGPGAGRCVPLEPGEHRLGSHRYSRIVLADPALARVHLLIDVDELGGVTVSPAGRDVVCRLDGWLLSGPARPAPGQLLAAGHSLLTFGRPGEAARPALPPVAPPLAGPPRIEAPPAPLAGAGSAALGATAVGSALAAALAAAVWGVRAALVPAALAPVTGLSAITLGHRRHREARSRFRRLLDDLDRALTAARAAGVAELTASAPDAADLLARLEAGPGPWGRHPGDPDWLRLRIGWADRPFGLGPTVVARGAPALRTEAVRVAVRHATLHGAPVSVSLPEHGPLGIAGSSSGGLALARWMALQLVGLHPPGEVVVTAAVPAVEREGFGWLTTLPHAGARLPALALGPEEGARLVDLLAALITERAGDGTPDAARPAVVAFLHCAVVPPIARALGAGRRVGVHVVWLDVDEARRRSCAAVVDLAGRAGATLDTGPGEPSLLGGADGLSAELALRAAQALRRPAAATGRATLAGPTELADLLGAGGQPEQRVLAAWVRDRLVPAPRALRALVGLDLAGRPVELDLERGGPHVLVTARSGRDGAALLGAVVAALGVRHAPRSLNLLLVGAAPDAFAGVADLPHVLDRLADPAEERLAEALALLDEELRWRREVARPASAPALVIAVDELPAGPLGGRLLRSLAQLAKRRPAGVHLLVASRRPRWVEAALGPGTGLRVSMSGPGEAARLGDAAGRTWEVRPAGTASVGPLVAAAAAVGRMLGQPVRAEWPSRAALLGSRAGAGREISCPGAPDPVAVPRTRSEPIRQWVSEAPQAPTPEVGCMGAKGPDGSRPRS